MSQAVTVLPSHCYNQMGSLVPRYIPGKSTPISTLSLLLNLLPTGSEEREVLGVGSIPVAILPSCQDMETITL